MKMDNAEIEELRSTQNTTRRPISPGLEEILYTPFPVLNHGFVRVVDYLGNDNSIVQAARTSYGRGTKSVTEDVALINYLLRAAHSGPFEMCEITFHVKLPLFVARQIIRHRTVNVNELSARYSILDNEFYIPDESVLAIQSTKNKQGRDQLISGDEAKEILNILKTDALQAYSDYEYLLNDKDDPNHDPDRSSLARELARMNLSLNFYTQWYWKIDARNLMHFLGLRSDPHAQLETRLYSNIKMDILKAWLPITHAAFLEHKFYAKTFSASALKVIKNMINGLVLTQAESGLGKREYNELMNTLNSISIE
jgi:thymidylate synthase (FAD)